NDDGSVVRSYGPLLVEDKIGVVLAHEQSTGLVDIVRAGLRRRTSERRVATYAQALELASEPDVLEVERTHLPIAQTEFSRASVGADALQQFSVVHDLPHYAGLSGRGIRAAIVDTGVLPTHPDLQRYDASGAMTGSRVLGTPPDGMPNSDGWHG